MHKKFILEFKDNYVFVCFLENTYLQYADVKDMYNILEKNYNKYGNKLNLLLDVNNVIGTSKRARDLGVSEVAIKVSARLSLVTDSVISKLMANFFIRVNPPPYPIKLVKDEKDGLKFLQILVKD